MTRPHSFESSSYYSEGSQSRISIIDSIEEEPRVTQTRISIIDSIQEEPGEESQRLKEAKRKEIEVIPLGQAELGKSTLQKQFQESQRINDSIEEELRKESQRLKEAKRKEIKVLLLGQAESGKSNLQKQFQLYYASKIPDSEKPSWKPVVHFNIIKAVRTIMEFIEHEFSRPPGSSSAAVGGEESEPYDASETEKEELYKLRTRLLPFASLHDALAAELSEGVSISGGRTGPSVRSGWQGILSRRNQSAELKTSKQAVAGMAAKALHAAQDDITSLWNHPVVRGMISLRKIRLEESAPFFLENLSRISEPDYVPSTDDVSNSRLRTKFGVIEYSFPVLLGGSVYEWRLYNLGGARGQRHAWVPYFDDATAIIFLAPISAFDQYLDEDPRTNRIDDSLQLFTSICSHKLLKNAPLVLILNKTDLLRAKLNQGISVRKYITSYGSRPNKYEDVASYLRAQFVQVHKRKDTSGRSLNVHFTSTLDIKVTQSANVAEAIIRRHLTFSQMT